MFWWFEREGRYLRCEILELATGRFELRVVDADGSEQVEHFDHADDLARRQHVLMNEISRAGWNGPHGWVL